MKRTWRTLLARTALVTAIAAAAMAQTGAKPAGHWEGKIQIPDHELPMVLELDRNPAGTWIGSLSVTGSTSIDVPIGDLKVDGSAVRFAATLPQRATFEGQLSADGKTLSGTAANADGQAPFQLTRTGEAHVKVPAPSSAMPPELEGYWEGTVESSGRTRRVGLKLARVADGTATATLVAVDQGNLEIPVATVTIQEKRVQLDAPAISGTYKGTLTNGDIVGEWAQGATHMALTFKRTK